jgi:hypothetical protein
MINDDNDNNGDDSYYLTAKDVIINRYGREGYKHIMKNLTDICNNGNFNTYYFLDEYKVHTWISNALPRENYTLSNIDLVLEKYDRENDKLGTFKVLEFKDTKYNRLRKAQELLFGLIDRMLRTSQESYRYEGFYLARVDLDNKIFIVNDKILTEDEFKRFLRGELQIKSYRFRMKHFL